MSYRERGKKYLQIVATRSVCIGKFKQKICEQTNMNVKKDDIEDDLRSLRMMNVVIVR